MAEFSKDWVDREHLRRKGVHTCSFEADNCTLQGENKRQTWREFTGDRWLTDLGVTQKRWVGLEVNKDLGDVECLG